MVTEQKIAGETPKAGEAPKTDPVAERLAAIEGKLDKQGKVSEEEKALISSLLAEDEDEPEPTKQTNTVDIEKMSKAELASFLSDRFSQELEKREREIRRELQEHKSAYSDDKLRKRIAEVRSADVETFDKHLPAMIEIANRYGSLDPEDAFLLAWAKKAHPEHQTRTVSEKAELMRKAGASGSGASLKQSLIEGLKGKSHRDVALEIAGKMGL
jgi:hypothetical protein